MKRILAALLAGLVLAVGVSADAHAKANGLRHGYTMTAAG